MDAITQGSTLQTSISPHLRKSKEPVPSSDSPDEKWYEKQEAKDRLKLLMSWRRQARVAQEENRTQQAIDEDFYDGIQLDAEDLKILQDRNQPPVVYNVIKNTMNWVIGTERRTRFDFRVLPRKKTGAAVAKTKTKVVKYVQDISKGEFERSIAFTEAAIAGIGWMEYGARNNGGEPIFMRSERWRNMWFDHLAVRADGKDARFVFREKWVDLDVAQAMFPGRYGDLKQLAEGVNSLYPYLPDDTVITDNASEFDLESDLDSLFGGPFDGARERVKIIECQYRMPARVKIIKMRGNDTPYGALDGAIYRPDNADHQYLVQGRYAELEEKFKMTVRHAAWAGAFFLRDALSPYNHDLFDFVPIFCYRRRRDNMPYGIVRDLRDPQSDLNKRRSKALFLLSANRVIFEKGAVDNPANAYDEINKPDGMVEVNPNKRFDIQKEQALARAHVEMAQDDERFIHSIAGVTNDAEYQTRKDLSGIAIKRLENQSSVGQGILFDNAYYSYQAGGEITLSNIEQFYDQEKEFRITGDQHKDEFVEINKQKEDGTIENSIIESKADFVLSKQDYRESIRQAQVEMLGELVTKLAAVSPDAALALLDLVIELMDDLPNKDEAVARIRKINKQHAPEDELTEEEKIQVKKTEEQVAQEQAALKQINIALAQIKVAEGQSKIMKDHADAALKKIDGFLKALEVAGVLKNLPVLAEGADALIESAMKAGEPGNGNQPQKPGQVQ